MGDIKDCPDCGGTHFGSSKCPFTYKSEPLVQRFRVSLHRRIFAPGERPRNPFYAGIPREGVTHEMSVRTWAFEAANERHVRKLLEQAQEAGHPNVAGYTVRSIERVPDCCRTPCPEQICRAMTAEGMCFARDAAGGRR